MKCSICGAALDDFHQHCGGTPTFPVNDSRENWERDSLRNAIRERTLDCEHRIAEAVAVEREANLQICAMYIMAKDAAAAIRLRQAAEGGGK